MPFRPTAYRVFVASPSDVTNERRTVRQVIFDWNDLYARSNVVLLPITWETHAQLQMGGRPQDLLNEQLLVDADILVGVFWTRLGTPTGRAESGTVEEIEEFLRRGKPVLLYFSRAPVPPDRVDPEQYRKLREFRSACRRRGIVWDYDSVEQLGDLVHRHLLATLRGLQEATDQAG